MRIIFLILVFHSFLIEAYGQSYEVLNYNFNGTPTKGIKIKTNLPYLSSSQMPSVRIEGYSYGIKASLGINLVWYIYNGEFISYSASSWGGHTPKIFLSNESDTVVIFIEDKTYFQRFKVSVYAKGMGEVPAWFSGWSAVDEGISGSNTVEVSYLNKFVNVSASGKVAIGTEAPGALLHVAQNDGVADAVRAPIIMSRYWADANNTRGAALFNYFNSINGNDQLVFAVSGNGDGVLTTPVSYSRAKMVVQGNGNVGIGTTNPSARLQVFSSNNPTIQIGGDLGQGTTGGSASLTWRANNGILDNVFTAKYKKDASNDRLTFTDGGNVDILTMKNGGNVGIGTTVPVSKLEVGGANTAFPTTGVYQQLEVTNGSAHRLSLGVLTSAVGSAGAGTAVIQSLTNGSAFTNLALNPSAGNIGIGTASPNYKLSIAGGGAQIDGGATGEKTFMYFSNSGTSNGFIGSDYAAYGGSALASNFGMYVYGNNKLYFSTNGSRRVVIDGDGNVGIGTTKPKEKLSVNGTILAKKVRVSVNSVDWPDYVFHPGYRLRSLSALEKYLKKHHHLPGVPSAKDVEAKGVDLASNQAALLRKIEELTLYVIAQGKKMEEQNKEIKKLKETVRKR